MAIDAALLRDRYASEIRLSRAPLLADEKIVLAIVVEVTNEPGPVIADLERLAPGHDLRRPCRISGTLPSRFLLAHHIP